MSSDYRKPSGEPEEEMSVELELEDGTKVNCAVITILEVEGKNYIVLLPLDEAGNNEDGEVWFYGYSEMRRIPMRSPSFATLRMMRNMRSWRTPLTNIWTTVNLTS